MRLSWIAVLLLIAAPAVAAKPIVAVFEIQTKRVRLDRGARSSLSDYLATRLTASGAYEIVPRAQLKRALRAQKKASYKRCYAQTCQIEIGRELAAQKSLATQIMKIGHGCVVTATLYDLRRATTEKGATAKGSCDEEGLMTSIDSVVDQLGGKAVGAAGGAGVGTSKVLPQLAERLAGPKIRFELYVMSKCPFGTQVENSLAQVLATPLGERVDLRIDYIMSDREGKLAALHGPSELQGNIVELCAMRHHPDPRRYLPFLECQNDSFKEVPRHWQRCARRAGLSVARIRRCVSGGEGRRLARASLKRAEAAGARGSPTIVIAGQEYRGGRSAKDFTRALCGRFLGTDQPAVCRNLPPSVPVDAVVISDRRCKKCDTKGVERNLRARFFPKLRVRWLDYGSREGRRLYRRLGLKHLPAVLLTRAVRRSSNYASIERWLEPRGDYLQLRVPASFDPTAEICDNRVDDTRNGLVDCADPGCRGKLECRMETKGTLVLFMMSQCPFASKALTSLRKVIPRLGAGLRLFDTHYIADETPDGIKALHGPSEVAENMRQLCAKRLYPRRRQYLRYMQCRAEDYRSSRWEPCARRAGLSVQRIEGCVARRGEALLAADLKLAKKLVIVGSPTWLVNNRYKATGIKPDQILKLFCEHNPAAPGCS